MTHRSFVPTAGRTQHVNVSFCPVGPHVWAPHRAGLELQVLKTKTTNCCVYLCVFLFVCVRALNQCPDRSFTWLRTRTCPSPPVPDQRRRWRCATRHRCSCGQTSTRCPVAMTFDASANKSKRLKAKGSSIFYLTVEDEKGILHVAKH